MGFSLVVYMKSEKPKVLFHGTNGKYAQEQIKDGQGSYVHSEGDVHVTDSMDWAHQKAIQQMWNYGGPRDKATLLVIDSSRLDWEDLVRQPTVSYGHWTIEGLPPESFHAVDVTAGLTRKAQAEIDALRERIENM